MKARLHPHWVGGRDGYRYSVLFEASCSLTIPAIPSVTLPALCWPGITGKLTMLDGKTGRPRTIVDIRQRDGLRLESYAGTPHSEGYSPETEAKPVAIAEPRRRNSV